MRTTESITGTSISTPTTVASAAPECTPNRPTAVATASSKKLLAPISAEGPATQCGTPKRRLSQYARPALKYTWIRIGTASSAMIAGCAMICRPWKPNSSTRVASSANRDAGPSCCSSLCNRASPPPASTRRRSSTLSTTGTTMYSSTDSSSVFHGTVIDEMPSSSATIGANATTMMASFRATWLSVNAGSPLHRLLHTNTIAVHGAAASRIRPAM